MAREADDWIVADLFGRRVELVLPQEASRPKTGTERTRAWRQRKREAKEAQQALDAAHRKVFAKLSDAECARYAVWFAEDDPDRAEALWRELGRRKGWLK